MKTMRAKWLRQASVQRVFALVTGAGGQARIAGGAVRNALMGKAVADIDFATTLSPQAVMQIFMAAGHAAHPTGIDHGTVTVVVDGHAFEVTTLRKDVTTDGRRAVVSFTDDWRADALRRDFTMNALYCDANGKIHDFTNGYEDILKNRIRFVGNPTARIKEDYLRILRYFRFLSTFGKLKVGGDGVAACVRLRKGLLTLSAERISQEMQKLLTGEKAVPVLKLMAAHKVLRNVIDHTNEFRTVSRLPPDAILRAFALAQNPLALKEMWRLSNQQAERIKKLSEFSLPSLGLRPDEQRRILYQMGEQAWRDSVHLAWARSRTAPNDRAWKRMLLLPQRWSIPEFPVLGRDLIALGHAAGPDLGQTLKQLEELWIASDFKPSKHDLLKNLTGVHCD